MVFFLGVSAPVQTREARSRNLWHPQELNTVVVVGVVVVGGFTASHGGQAGLRWQGKAAAAFIYSVRETCFWWLYMKYGSGGPQGCAYFSS